MKPGNRRKKRPEYLLDVKVQTRGRALGRLRVVVAIAVSLGLLAAAGYGMYWSVKAAVNRFVYNNPRFAIRQIVVDNDGVLTPDRVVRFAGV